MTNAVFLDTMTPCAYKSPWFAARMYPTTDTLGLDIQRDSIPHITFGGKLQENDCLKLRNGYKSSYNPKAGSKVFQRPFTYPRLTP
jgi:hypothetical protein